MTSLSHLLAGSLNFPMPEKVSAAQIILTLAGGDIARVFRSERFEEEPITAAFAGSIAAHAQWVMPIFSDQGVNDHSISWGHYRKNKGAVTDGCTRPSESDTGADFSLLVRVSQSHMLLSVFQCKKSLRDSLQIGSDGKLTIDLWRGSGDGESGDGARKSSQLINLVGYSKKLIANLAHLRNEAGVVSSDKCVLGDWVHYMIYRKGDPCFISLPNLDAAIDHQRDGLEKMTSHRVSFGKEKIIDFGSLVDFSKILDEGVPSLKGWLTLTVDEAEQLVPFVYDLTGSEVVVVDDQGGGGRPFEPSEGEVDSIAFVNGKAGSKIFDFFINASEAMAPASADSSQKSSNTSGYRP